ncbi:hypothetical protein VB776_02735 [Arcicella sp. DC2W]|uniref:Uncharacterized protein n=1 Tax=Arcicella gelida TaxID=2984195 RepID=A0ABU5S024_9BACT|nr:hypothetical protein [Arcicella sp. DC2W]MEA5401815.1 hypothetical protein [Arcicella sp. DC2W]
MQTTQETGNAVNISNFESLIAKCITFGERYNPSRELLKIPNLENQLSVARDLLDQSKTFEAAYNNAVIVRKTAFASLKPLGTKVVGALSIAGLDDAVVEKGKAIIRKIRGQRATAKPEAYEENGITVIPKTISSSHQSYDYLIEHLNSLIALLNVHPEYNPNEIELKVASLQEYSAELRTANTAVINASVALDMFRKQRNKTLYEPKIGLVAIAFDVKTYVKTVFGVSSNEYNQVSGIAFRSLK